MFIIKQRADQAASHPVPLHCRCEWKTSHLHSVPFSVKGTQSRSLWRQVPSADSSPSVFPHSTEPAGRSAAAALEPIACSPSHVPMHHQAASWIYTHTKYTRTQRMVSNDNIIIYIISAHFCAISSNLSCSHLLVYIICFPHLLVIPN